MNLHSRNLTSGMYISTISNDWQYESYSELHLESARVHLASKLMNVYMYDIEQIQAAFVKEGSLLPISQTDISY